MKSGKKSRKSEMKYRLSSILLASDVLEANTRVIENRLFEFANFLESKIVMLYVNSRK
jgi:5-formyltetrahydrofolate cyclo-ligase